MVYNDAVDISEKKLIHIVAERYGLKEYVFKLLPSDGECNLVYSCKKDGADDRIIRISFLGNRSYNDLLSETEYVRYLHEKGCAVANVIASRNGKLVEEIDCENHMFYVVQFEKAPGKRFVDNHYRYREGVPITEYYYNCGKVLGRIHQASKEYKPVYRRYSFFDKYTPEYIDKIIPPDMTLLKKKLKELLYSLQKLPQSRENFGMVHFDFCDGNYHIDFDSGKITVYDFDNACYCWYMYDLADLWMNGTGWICHSHDITERKRFMEEYFRIALDGYRSETEITDDELKYLPLFLQVTAMEGIIDDFEGMQNSGEEPEIEEGKANLIKCMEEDIFYHGFFSE